MADITQTPVKPGISTIGSSGIPKPKLSVSSLQPLKRPSNTEKNWRKSTPLTSTGGTESSNGVSNGLSANPLNLELNRLENEIKVKGLEIENLRAELKGLKQLNIGKDKSIATLKNELEKLKEIHSIAEKQLDGKILELKKANNQKREAMSTQAAAEATMRRLQAAQKDTSLPSSEKILAPLEAELKIAHKEVAKLTEDNKAQERLMRTKEAALVEAETAVAVALEKAAQVDDLLNVNRKLEKQIEAAEEENKTLDKMYKQKVEEVKKLTEDVASLEESLTNAGAAASIIMDNQRQVKVLQAENKLMQEELARAKVAVSRVAVVVANEWKDDQDKVISLHQYLDERKYIQGEIHSLKDKLALAERTAKFEGQMKEKYQARLKVIEESLKVNGGSGKDPRRRLSVGTTTFRSASLLASPAKEMKPAVQHSFSSTNGCADGTKLENDLGAGHDGSIENQESVDTVSGILYDHLQKEVVMLRKAKLEKDSVIKDKDDAMEMLSRKVELLTKAMETESKKSRREISALEKELAALKVDTGSDPRRRLSTGRDPSYSSIPRKAA